VTVTVLAIGSVGFKIRIPRMNLYHVNAQTFSRTTYDSYFVKLLISTFIVYTSIYFYTLKTSHCTF